MKIEESAAGLIIALITTTLSIADGGDLPCYYEPTIVFGPQCSAQEFCSPTPHAINSAGQVAGGYDCCLSPAPNAFVWSEGSGLITLPPPAPGYTLVAEDITDPSAANEFGLVAGWNYPFTIPEQGFIYDGRNYTLLEPLPGGAQTSAAAINAAGVAVGVSKNSGTSHYLAAMWTSAQAQQIPGLLGPDSEAKDINDACDITGWMGEGPTVEGSHAFLWQNGQVTELQIPDGALSLDPQAISNDQEIVGYVRYLHPDLLEFRPFTWSAGIVTELPVLSGHTHGLPQDVSDPGVIVGFCTGEDLAERAVVWHQGAIHDLNDMVPDPDDVIFLRRAASINDDGIVATLGRAGPENNDHTVLFVLTPVYPAVGDLDCDETVGPNDLSILLAQWGAGDSLPADFDGDGTVGPYDARSSYPIGALYRKEILEHRLSSYGILKALCGISC